MSLVHVQTMARYNRWMNQKVYDGCSGLPDEDRKRDMGAFFKSIHTIVARLLPFLPSLASMWALPTLSDLSHEPETG